MADLTDEINAVVRQITDVQASIKEAEDNVLDPSKSDQRGFWEEKLNALRQEKDRLRQKEHDLRQEKHDLRQEKHDLRQKEIALINANAGKSPFEFMLCVFPCTSTIIPPSSSVLFNTPFCLFSASPFLQSVCSRCRHR